MKCKKCGWESETGKYCVKCGAKYEEKDIENINEAHLKAKYILNEYRIIEEEKQKIMEIGWSNDSNREKKLSENIEKLNQIVRLELKTEGAKQEIEKKKKEIIQDYRIIKGKKASFWGQVIFGIIATILSIVFLFPMGILGIIIGGVIIWAFWAAVVDVVKKNAIIDELEEKLKKEKII